MLSPRSLLLKGFFLFSAILVSHFGLFAQCNPEEGGATCQNAPIVCLNNLCDATEVNPPDGSYTGFCGSNTAIHNPQYFTFIATSTHVFFQIMVGDCMGGQNSLQAAIVSSCPWTGPNEVLDCNPGAPEASTFTLEVDGLVIGQPYILLFDGSAASQCDYTIEIAQGVFEPELTNEIDEVEASPSEPVCQGFNNLTLLASPEVGNAHGYWWIPEWDPLDTLETTDPQATFSIPPDLEAGTYEVCVLAFSGCDTSDMEVCLEIEVYEIPPEEKPEEYFCPEEFPFNWGTLVINGPGEYEQTFTTAEGCAFDSTWVVEEYPEVPLGILDTMHCEESLYYEGEFYDDAGTYTLEYPGMGLNGCDSTAELNVTLAYLDAFIELSCENGEFILTVLIQELIPTSADIEYEWYESGILLPDMENQIFLLDGGVYDCIVTVITPAGECSFALDQFSFNAADYRPDPPNMGFLDTLVCAQSGIFFEVIVDPFEDPYTYTWYGPANVPIFQDGSPIAEFDFSSAGPSEICVFATNDCGDGPPFCFNVDIQATPVADFSFEPEICTDSLMIVTFTGSASPLAEVIWDFNNPSVLMGSGLGPYTVGWSIPGNKVINLTVIEPGCDTAYNSAVVTVQSFLPPVVNCSSTIDSVHFEWNDVSGASGYLVSINGNPPVSTSTSYWDVSGLNPGAVVNMTLTVVSAGACDDIIVMSSCTAEDCPAPTIVLSGPNTSCLNAPSILDIDALVNGLPGVGTWTGAGIVDANQGLFDPTVAGSGVHQITFTVIENGCDFSDNYSVTVFDSLTADFVLDPLICITDIAGLTYMGNASGAATYNYDFGTAIVVAGTGAGPYQLRWASPGQKTVRLQVTENGCSSEVVSHTTDVIAELAAPIINCSPNTSGVVMSWEVDPSAGNYVVNVLQGPVGTPIGIDSLEFTPMVPGDSVLLEIVSVSAGPCPDRRDSLYCIARECPMPVITLTPVDDICLYPGTQDVDLQVSVVNGAGSGVWSGPGVTDVTNGEFSPTVAGPGAHQIRYTYDDDGCQFIESMIINVYDLPDAFISNTDLMITCASGSIILDGSSSSGGPLNYVWSTGDVTAYAEVTVQGTYQLLVVNTTSGCKDSTSVSVTQDANIPVANAGPDQTLSCDVTIVTVGGTSTTGPNVVYEWTTPDGRIIGVNDETTIQADLPGEYIIMVSDTSNGCASSDNAMVGIDTAVATITLTPGDTIDCNTPVSTITSTITGNVSDYSFSWSTVDGMISGGSTGQDLQVSQGGTYTLTIQNNQNGCEESGDVDVEESDEIIDAVDVTTTNVVCFGDQNGTITVHGVTGGNPPYTYAWSGTGQSGTDLTNLGPGVYTLTVSDQNGCSFIESFEVIEPPKVTINVGPDMTVRAMDSVIISMITNIAPGAVGSIDWHNSDGTLNCVGCPSVQFIASSSTTITAMIIDTSGCDASDSMRLTVVVPRIFYIPNVFSPNGDGINDYFSIYGRFNLINIGYLRIFDRWGNLAFENTDFPPNEPARGWDGKFDGEPMQPGVYAFTARLDYEDGISEVVHGDITIVR